jgi:hypothetical protein
MATSIQRRALRRRVRKAVKEAKQQRTIVRLSPKTRKELARKGVKAARRQR